MPADTAGQWPATSTTARPAENRTKAEAVNPAVMRRAVDGYQAVAGCRRKEARERIQAWLRGAELRDLAPEELTRALMKAPWFPKPRRRTYQVDESGWRTRT